MADTEFEGFDPTQTTPIPNSFFDLAPHLTGAELKVLLYIIGRRPQHPISQLQQACGLPYEDLMEVLQSLETKGHITHSIHYQEGVQDV